LGGFFYAPPVVVFGSLLTECGDVRFYPIMSEENVRKAEEHLYDGEGIGSKSCWRSYFSM
jgi:hypothetical protein